MRGRLLEGLWWVAWHVEGSMPDRVIPVKLRKLNCKLLRLSAFAATSGGEGKGLVQRWYLYVLFRPKASCLWLEHTIMWCVRSDRDDTSKCFLEQRMLSVLQQCTCMLRTDL